MLAAGPRGTWDADEHKGGQSWRQARAQRVSGSGRIAHVPQVHGRKLNARVADCARLAFLQACDELAAGPLQCGALENVHVGSDVVKAAWSSGMILGLGPRGPGFNSRSSPFVFLASSHPSARAHQRRFGKEHHARGNEAICCHRAGKRTAAPRGLPGRRVRQCEVVRGAGRIRREKGRKWQRALAREFMACQLVRGMRFRGFFEKRGRRANSGGLPQKKHKNGVLSKNR